MMVVRRMALCALVGWLSALPVTARTAVKRQGDLWLLENERLRVVVDPRVGSLTVRDKVSGYEWRQPTGSGVPARVTFRQAPVPLTIDGNLPEWTGGPTALLTHRMTADAKKVDSDKDCSAEVWCSWDAASLYLAARVHDDAPKFGPTGFETWWERDALELWVGGRQVGLNLNPTASQARTSEGAISDARVVVRPGNDGYTVEAAVPWKAFAEAPKPAPGVRFRFAIGVNDADETGAREGQLYFPSTWVHSNPLTFAEAALADKSGVVPPTPSAPAPKFRNVSEIAGPPAGLSFEADFGTTKGRPNTLAITLMMPEGASDLVVDADMADRNTEVTGFSFLEPFVLDTDKSVLAVADYSNGHLYPLNVKPFPHGYFGGDRLDMPWVGVCDLDKGMGYALILDTSDDAWVRCGQYNVGGRQIAAPQVGWNPSKGKFACARRILYRFAATGSYVALAKAYRAYAKEKGLIVPFAEKLKANPNIRRLFGAPDVWGNDTLAFAQQAKAAGVDKMLIHGRTSPADMKAINDLGYLTSEYDNYTDILQTEEGKQPDSSHDQLPDAAVLNPDRKRMTAWLTWDKKTQYMKRCPALWVPTAKVVIPNVLKEFPYIGRFIDVTTAEGLYECHDEKHPLTKGQKRQCGVALLSFVRSQRLVVGGEHGIWWGVPEQDYIEGMMSGGWASWPAGHLIHPKTKDEEFSNPWGGKSGGRAGWANYEKWGIGHEWRAPLWELVFHDCVVSTWYWGDASDWLLQAAPEVTPKKDAFNILYGTIPLLWANREGSWHAAREVFLRTYRNTCKLHEVLAGTEMLSHEFLTPDHTVQRTRFSDGTQVVVNFGEKPYTAEMGARKYLLPQNGFAVKGPRIEQSLALEGNKPVTTVRTQGYLFSDAGGVETTIRALGEDQLRVHLGTAGQPVTFRPADVAARWDLRSTRAFALDSKGQRVTHVELRRSGHDSLRLGPFTEATVFDLVCRSKAALPDLWFDAATLTVNPDRPKQGEKVKVVTVLHNSGGAAARGIEVTVFADAAQQDCRMAREIVSLAPDGKKTIAVSVDTLPLDGARHLVVVADPESKVTELCERNNDLSRAIEVTPDYARWQHRRTLQVDTGEFDRDNEPVVTPLDLPNAAPASVRVAECDHQGNPKTQVPAQFDASEDGRGELCFLLPGKTAARVTRRFLVLWNEAGRAATVRERALLPPPANLWNPAEKAVEGETYRAEFNNGTLVNLTAKRDGLTGKPFISMLILSSQETGWGDEPGNVERFEVIHAGPVRTTLHVRKVLKAGVVYEKTYVFYPRRFDVTISVNKPAGGLYSRAYYLQAGQYVDDQGFRAKVDGTGDAEGIYAKARNPKWYAVYAPDWAHSCIALSSFDHIAYWDSGYWGGIGLVTGATKELRMSYVIRAGAQDVTFAQEDHQRLTSLVTVAQE